jgi:hypothetical protein
MNLEGSNCMSVDNKAHVDCWFSVRLKVGLKIMLE